MPERDRFNFSDADREAAAEILQSQSTQAAPILALRDVNGSTVDLPRHLSELLMDVVTAIAQGHEVTIRPASGEMTTSCAAQEIGVSRPTLMKLVGEGVIPAHKVGTHTRLHAEDVLAYRDKRLDEQRRTFDALRNLDDQL